METLKLGKSKHITGHVFNTPVELAEHLAKYILKKIELAKQETKAFYLGCPSGRSPFDTYVKLGELAGKHQQDLSHVVLVMMDDYVIKKDNGFMPVPAEAHYSCRRFAYVDIVDRMNVGLPEEKQVSKENVWFPPIDNPAAYDDKIKDVGGIDLFIVASGGRDGHIAFNPVGSPADSPTRIIKLAEETMKDNLATFPDFKDLSEVPKYGISIGLKAILELSKEHILIIHGKHKQFAVAQLNKLDDFSPNWPVSIIFRSNNATAYLDKAAVGSL